MGYRSRLTSNLSSQQRKPRLSWIMSLGGREPRIDNPLWIKYCHQTWCATQQKHVNKNTILQVDMAQRREWRFDRWWLCPGFVLPLVGFIFEISAIKRSLCPLGHFGCRIIVDIIVKVSELSWRLARLNYSSKFLTTKLVLFHPAKPQKLAVGAKRPRGHPNLASYMWRVLVTGDNQIEHYLREANRTTLMPMMDTCIHTRFAKSGREIWGVTETRPPADRDVPLSGGGQEKKLNPRGGFWLSHYIHDLRLQEKLHVGEVMAWTKPPEWVWIEFKFNLRGKIFATCVATRTLLEAGHAISIPKPVEFNNARSLQPHHPTRFRNVGNHAILAWR